MKHKLRKPGFTLLEAIVSSVLLISILATIVVAFYNTTDSVDKQILRRRAYAVAQRHMELLLASQQEPESYGLPNPDDLDLFFNWQLDLKRTSADDSPPKPNLSNTVIVATVTVDCIYPESKPFELVELTRYFATLKPKPGEAIAVPLTQDKEEELWMIKLREKLGREPTTTEILQHLFKIEGLPQELLEDLDLEPDETPEGGSGSTITPER